MIADLLENVLTPILVINDKKIIVEANRYFYDVFGEIEIDNLLINAELHPLIDIIIKGNKQNISSINIFEWTNGNLEKHFFDIELAKISTKNNKKINILILFKDITDQYQMAQKTIRRSEELSILLDISFSESELKSHKEILHIVNERLTLLTKYNYGMFLFYNHERKIDEIVNLNFEDEFYKRFCEEIEKKEYKKDFFNINKPLILKEGAIKALDLFKIFLELNTKEIVIFKTGMYGVFLLSSDYPYNFRITQEENFFSLLGQQIGRALQRANLYHRLEHSRNELETKNRTINKQLELAQSIQSSILTINKDENLRLEYAIKYIPSGFLSGDLYDVWKVSEYKSAVLIADVCGHGVSSALVTAFMKATIREIVTDKTPPGEIFTKLNDKLVDILPFDMYVSAFLIIADAGNQTLEYSTAGHPSQFYYDSKKKELIETPTQGGTLLSVIKGIPFQTHQMHYNKGDRIILFTDGIYELRSEIGEIYSRNRFQNFVRNNILLPKEELLEAIVQNAYEVTKQNFLEDDVNLIIIDL